MIVINGYVLITPPKNGSTTLARALCRDGPGMQVLGPQGDGDETGTHNRVVGADYEHLPRALVVRSPFDRVVSLYHQHARYAAKHGLGIAAFCEWLPAALAGEHGWFHAWPSSAYDLAGDAKTVRLETLTADLCALLNLEIEALPHLMRSDRLAWDRYLDETAIELVRDHYADDFARGRYDVRSGKPKLDKEDRRRVRV